MPKPLSTPLAPNKSDYDLPGRRFDFGTDLKFGHVGEALVAQFLDSLGDGSFEVKSDRYRNGRMVVETSQNPKLAGYKPSGLAVTKAAWWVYVYSIEGAFVVLSVDRLKRYIATLDKSRIRTFAAQSSNPTKGYLLMPDEVMSLLHEPKYDSAT